MFQARHAAARVSCVVPSLLKTTPPHRCQKNPIGQRPPKYLPFNGLTLPAVRLGSVQEKIVSACPRRAALRESDFTFSACSVPTFDMELSSGIIPETSLVHITSISAALGNAEITLRKRTAGDCTFLHTTETKTHRRGRLHIQITRMMSHECSRFTIDLGKEL